MIQFKIIIVFMQICVFSVEKKMYVTSMIQCDTIC